MRATTDEQDIAKLSSQIDFDDLFTTDDRVLKALRVLKWDAPLGDDVELASQIISRAPRTGSPLDVAEYFRRVETRTKDGVYSFTSEWGHGRSNPIIIAFFGAAGSVDHGDQDETPWCAAFVNWCIERVGGKGTKSAMSGSFRKSGNRTVRQDPRPGDIAVFRDSNRRLGNAGYGHVGFYVGDTGRHISVLGGNQSNRISYSEYKKRAWWFSQKPRYMYSIAVESFFD